LSCDRHDKDVAIIGATCSAKMGMTETVYHRIAVMISRATIPAFKPGIRGKLDHANGKLAPDRCGHALLYQKRIDKINWSFVVSVHE